MGSALAHEADTFDLSSLCRTTIVDEQLSQLTSQLASGRIVLAGDDLAIYDHIIGRSAGIPDRIGSDHTRAVELGVPA